MIFNVLKASTIVSRWEDRDGSTRLRLEVVPKDRDVLEIGDDYIVCRNGSLAAKTGGRESVPVQVEVHSPPEDLSYVGGKRPICGHVDFYPPREGRLGDFDQSASLVMHLFADAQTIHEMLRLAIPGPGSATLQVSIEGLGGRGFDISHNTWDLEDDTDCGRGRRRRITSFAYEVEQFQATEGDIWGAEQERMNKQLAESADPNDRKLAALGPIKPDPLRDLLKQCRNLLLIILALGLGIFWTISR